MFFSILSKFSCSIQTISRIQKGIKKYDGPRLQKVIKNRIENLL